MFCFVPAVAASLTGSVHGQILDLEGKPWPNLTIVFISQQGRQSQTKTDKNGNFHIMGLDAGTCTVRILIPGQEKPYESKRHIALDEDTAMDFNFKEIVAKQGGPTAEERKQQEETDKKFDSMKGHYTAGNELLRQAKELQASLQRAPDDQRDALKNKMVGLGAQAATEFQAARQDLGEKDPNLPLLWGKLATAYEVGGRDDDAIKTYEQALALKPDASYYNSLGNIFVRQGKSEEAIKMYTKSAEVDPSNAAGAWSNLGIALYNANRAKEAVEPLKKTLELEPNNAQVWYVLGSCLISLIDFKQEGDKMVPTVPPGTAEAFQKAIELDPNGPWGTRSKQALDGLLQIAPGVQTSVETKKKKG
jgi:tetratricopeptide (TPR) repeat protein